MKAQAMITMPTDELAPSPFLTILADSHGLFSGRPQTSGSFNFDPSYNGYEVIGGGYEMFSREHVLVGSGPGATTVSPWSMVVRWAGSEERVRLGLRVPDNYLNLTADVPALTTSSATGLQSADAAEVEAASRLAAANVRVLAVLMALSVTGNGARPEVTVPISQGGREVARELAKFIDANPTNPIFEGGFESLLRSRTDIYPRFHEDVIRAVSHLLTQYARASSRHVYATPRRAQYLLGVRAWLAPRLVDLSRRNDAATASKYLAIREADIERETAAIAAVHPQTNLRDYFIAGTDVVVMKEGERRTEGGDYPGLGYTHLKMNDYTFSTPGSPNPGDQDRSIVSVSVPAVSAGQVEAVLNADQSITISALPGFAGTSHFDYETRTASGYRATGRIYVVVP